MSNDKIELEYIPLSQLVKYPRNPKDHDIGQLSQAIDSAIGFATPIVYDTKQGYIGAGHGRLDALYELYRQHPTKPPKRIMLDPVTGEWLVPVNKLAFDSEEQLLSFIIMDNKISELGGWDEPLLADALTELAGGDEGLLELTGFDGGDLDALLNALGNNGTSWANALGNIPSGEKSDFSQMTFTLHTGQLETVKNAMNKAKKTVGGDEMDNANSNGNALYMIARAYLDG